VITGYSIVFASLLVTAGRSADRWGAGGVLRGMGVFSLGSALCGLAPSVSLLVAGRLIQGVRGGLPCCRRRWACCSVPFPSERRSQVVALWGGVGALAVATGPSLGALLSPAAGWRWAFYVNLPVALAVARGRPADPRSSAQRPTTGHARLPRCRAGEHRLAALVLGISEGPSWGWSSGGSSPASRPRRSSAPPSCTVRPITPSRCWT
jgi:DHA2 family methylenomycin A resistance protein-like MFS transporter